MLSSHAAFMPVIRWCVVNFSGPHAMLGAHNSSVFGVWGPTCRFIMLCCEYLHKNRIMIFHFNSLFMPLLSVKYFDTLWD